MKILLVEDDADKLASLQAYIESYFDSDVSIDESRSLRSALRTLMTDKNYDLVILDMSLPNFDINVDEPGGGTPESFAGKELMAQMKLRNILVPVVVVTQYSTFDGGSITLEELGSEFCETFEQFYKGIVYYNSAAESWKAELNKIISGIESD